MWYQLIDLKNNVSKGASLIAHQKEHNCPFEIKRVFYIYDIKQNLVRGEHANINSKFMFIMLNGECKIKIDNGFEVKIFTLKAQDFGLYIDKMVWKEMYDFKLDSVLLVLSDTYYDESEYIHDYNEFKKIINSIESNL